MDPVSQILAGLKAAWWLLWSVPAVPMAQGPGDRALQLLVGAVIVLGLCTAMLTAAV